MPSPLARECWPMSWVALGGESPEPLLGQTLVPRAYPRRGGPTPSPAVSQASCRVLLLGNVGPCRGSPWAVSHQNRSPGRPSFLGPTHVAVGQLPRRQFRKLHAESSCSGMLAHVVGRLGR